MKWIIFRDGSTRAGPLLEVHLGITWFCWETIVEPFRHVHFSGAADPIELLCRKTDVRRIAVSCMAVFFEKNGVVGHPQLARAQQVPGELSVGLLQIFECKNFTQFAFLSWGDRGGGLALRE